MADVPPGRVPIFQSIGKAFEYFAANVTRWVPAAVLVGLISGFLMYQYPDYYLSQLNGEPAILGSDQAFAMMGLTLVVALANVMFSTGVLRHALQGEFSPPIGVRLAEDEFRVIGAYLGLTLVFGIIAFFVMFVLGIMLAGMAANSGVDLAAGDPEVLSAALTQLLQGPGGGVFLVLLLVLMVLVVFAMVRLIFVQAATIAEDKMMVFSTWGLTKGNFWRVFAAALLVLIGTGFAAAVVQAVLMAALKPAPGITMFVFGAVYTTIATLLSIFMLSLIAYLYAGLRPRQDVDDVFQ